MSSLKDKIEFCVKIHYREEENIPVNITEVYDALTYLLEYVEGYYNNMEDKAEVIEPSLETGGFFYLQQILVKSIMEDVNEMKIFEKKFREQ
jgi:hypothetical protein